MGILLIPGLMLNINNNTILYKVPKSAVENGGKLIESGVSFGDYIFCLEKTGREISKIKIGDLPAQDKHRILLRFIKNLLWNNQALLRISITLKIEQYIFRKGEDGS